MILIFGTSIAWGAWDEKGGWAERVKRYAFENSLKTNFDNNTYVYPLGISGENSIGLLKRIETEVEARVWKDSKMQIIIETGINDSYYFPSQNKNSVHIKEYEENLLNIIEKSKQYNAELIFLGLTPVDKRVDPVPWRTEISFTMEYVKEYDKVSKRVCEEQNIIFV